MKKFLTCIICFLLVVSICSCSKSIKELDGVDFSSIIILFDYDEKTETSNSKYYSIDVVKSSNSSIKDYCTFTYYVEHSTIWTEDPDGTKHVYSIGDSYETLKYDISVFNDILKIINNGNPVVYSGPKSDSNKQLVFDTLPYMIVLKGTDKKGFSKKVFISKIDNNTALLDIIEKLKNK